MSGESAILKGMKKYFFAASAAALAMVFVAWQAGYSTGVKAPSSGTRTQVVQNRIPKEAKSITGKITGVAGTTISLQTFGTYSTQKNTERTVMTDAATIFERDMPKDQNAFQSELSAFSEKLQASRAEGSSLPSSAYPAPFTLEGISLSDLRVGDIVMVTAAENILTADSFTATKVVVESALSP